MTFSRNVSGAERIKDLFGGVDSFSLLIHHGSGIHTDVTSPGPWSLHPGRSRVDQSTPKGSQGGHAQTLHHAGCSKYTTMAFKIYYLGCSNYTPLNVQNNYSSSSNYTTLAAQNILSWLFKCTSLQAVQNILLWLFKIYYPVGYSNYTPRTS